ncbi:MAG: helix-turn-helix domain-containing protein [Spirochaetia bacterium]|nr:helix-turn-helix domain-containing protein [Spirochaetia bacterium]
MTLHVSKLKTNQPYEADFFHKQSFGLHTHSYFEIMISLSDGGRHWVNDRDYKIRRGEIFLLGPYHVHRADYGKARPKSHLNLGFSPGAILGNRTEVWHVLRPFLIPNFPMPLVLPEKVFRELLPLMTLLEREANGRDLYREQIGTSAFQSFLFLLARHFPKFSGGEDHAVLATLTRIAEGFRREVSTRNLASAEGLSPARLAQRFRKATGYTIKDALTQRRLIEARRLLEATSLSVTEVMTEAGFNDLSYFNRAFKSGLGKSPRAYRDTVKMTR